MYAVTAGYYATAHARYARIERFQLYVHIYRYPTIPTIIVRLENTLCVLWRYQNIVLSLYYDHSVDLTFYVL